AIVVGDAQRHAAGPIVLAVIAPGEQRHRTVDRTEWPQVRIGCGKLAVRRYRPACARRLAHQRNRGAGFTVGDPDATDPVDPELAEIDPAGGAQRQSLDLVVAGMAEHRTHTVGQVDAALPGTIRNRADAAAETGKFRFADQVVD